ASISGVSALSSWLSPRAFGAPFFQEGLGGGCWKRGVVCTYLRSAGAYGLVPKLFFPLHGPASPVDFAPSHADRPCDRAFPGSSKCVPAWNDCQPRRCADASSNRAPRLARRSCASSSRPENPCLSSRQSHRRNHPPHIAQRP